MVPLLSPGMPKLAAAHAQARRRAAERDQAAADALARGPPVT
jgi:hypothetical protein